MAGRLHLYLHEGFRKVEVVFVEGKKVANGYKNQPEKEQKDKENRESKVYLRRRSQGTG